MLLHALESVKSGYEYHGCQFETTCDNSLAPADPILTTLPYGPFHGGSTFFELGDVGGCSLGNVLRTSPSLLFYSNRYVAIRTPDWDVATHCGECIRVHNSAGTSVELMVADECPITCTGCLNPQPCSRLNWLDMSPEGFSTLGNEECEEASC